MAETRNLRRDISPGWTVAARTKSADRNEECGVVESCNHDVMQPDEGAVLLDPLSKPGRRADREIKGLGSIFVFWANQRLDEYAEVRRIIRLEG